MIIYDSGLSTTSLLNFSEKDIIEESVDNIIIQLEKLHSTPDLTDINSVWGRLSQTCGK